ncbi:MAG: sigma-70 family RNA polymerase sigma factor [Caldilineaceae bacterium]|nr:sigma-70 family RNA polymerase sigma factor [Caldilineaceae bacterium]
MDQQVVGEWRAVIEAIAQAEAWPLPVDGIAALANALSDRFDSSPPLSLATMRTIATHYYHDGPTVQQMCDSNSPAGAGHWQAWRQRIIRAAQKEGLSPEDAEDFVQQIFPGVQRSLQNFQFKASLTTFFAAIFRRQFAKWLQEHKYRRVVADELGEEVAATSDTVDMASKVEENEIRMLVRQEIQSILRSEDYQILYWYYVEEQTVDPQSGAVAKWTDKAIGERLAMPLNTVTARRKRALARLSSDYRLQQLFRELLLRSQSDES